MCNYELLLIWTFLEIKMINHNVFSDSMRFIFFISPQNEILSRKVEVFLIQILLMSKVSLFLSYSGRDYSTQIRTSFGFGFFWLFLTTYLVLYT